MSFRWILITYVIMAIVGLVINTFVFLPKTSFSLEKLNVTSHSNVELGMDNPGVSVDNVNERKNSERSGDPAPVVNGSSEQVENDKYLNGWRCILTCKYLWLFFYLSILQLRLWFFVGSLNTFLVFRTDNDQDKIDKYSSSFGIAQFFGFLFAPLTGIIMDMKPKNIKNPFFGPILSFIIANSLCVLLGVLVLVPVIEVQYLSFVVQVALRAFLYASLISFILRAFPVLHYGKLYGVCTLGGAIISLLQYPAFIILEGPFDGNPFWVNFGFLILSFIGFGLPLYLWLSNREPEEVTTTF